jgi:ribonuclease H / adenosylcobalamin/alpha-ribazole phosphatase
VRAILNTDGGARGNPGPAGIGLVLRTVDGEVIAETGRGIGIATNNVAEYEAVIAGLELALEHGVTDLELLIDSQLVAAQLEGRWKIKNDRLRALAVTARSLMNRFDSVKIAHVRRAHNARADRLANIGMDESMATGEDLNTGQTTLLE